MSEIGQDALVGTPPQLLAKPWPWWADASSTGAVVRAVASMPEPPYLLIDQALAVRWGVTAALTAIRILQALPPAASASRLREIQARTPVVKPDQLWQGYLPDRAMRAAIRGMLGQESDIAESTQMSDRLDALTGQLTTAGRGEDRAQAAERLADLEDLRVLPALQQAWRADRSRIVRRASARAMTSLGDTTLVEDWIDLLNHHDRDEELARIAAYALGGLAESHGLSALVDALGTGWRPGVIAEIAPTAGAGFVSMIVDRVMAEPKLSTRPGAVHALEYWGDVARPLIFEKLGGLLEAPIDVRRRRALLRLAECRPGLWRDVAGTILAWGETQAIPNENLMNAARAAIEATGDAYGPPKIGG